VFGWHLQIINGTGQEIYFLHSVSSFFFHVSFRISCKNRDTPIFNLPFHLRSRDSAVGRASGYGLGHRGVAVPVPVRSRIFSSLRHPDRFWGPLSLLFNGYRV
jgi:hypothetical protein